MSARRIERLLNLLITLSSPRPVSRADIRRGVPQYADSPSEAAFERKFERDKEELRALGVPITAGPVDVVFDDEIGYMVDQREYAFTAPAFTPAELATLRVAARVWDGTSMAAEARRALTKLAAVSGLATQASASQHGPTVQWATEPAGLRDVFDAVTRRQAVSFLYPGADGEAMTRHLQPWCVTSRRGIWYVTGFDTDREAARTFRLSRICSPVRSVGRVEAYVIPPDAHAAFSVQVQRSAESIEVQLAPGGAGALRAAWGFELSATTGRIDGVDAARVIPDLVQCGHESQVVSPSYVADDVERRRAEIAAAHAGDPEPLSMDGERTLAELTTRAADDPVPKKQVASQDTVDRLTRLLALVPYVTDNQGVEVSEVANRFGISAKQLVSDLELLFVCGAPGHLPDDLIDATWDDDAVYVHNADPISKPLRLTAAEVGVLTAGLHAVADGLGAEGQAAQTALATLSDMTSSDAPPVQVASGVESLHPTNAVLNEAIEHRVAVEMEYYTASRDVMAHRVVEPVRLFSSSGLWYVQGYCRTSEAMRVFRVDRVAKVRVTDSPSQHGQMDDAAGALVAGVDASDPWAVVAVTRDAAWLAEQPGVRVLQTGETGTVGRDILAVQYRRPMWLINLVFRCAGAAELLQPGSLRSTIRERAVTRSLPSEVIHRYDSRTP